MSYETLGLDNLLKKPLNALSIDSTSISSISSSLGETSVEEITDGEWNGNISINKGFLQSKNFIAGTSGWKLSDDGTLYAVNAIISGAVQDAIVIDYGSNILLKEGGSIKFTSVVAPTACTAALVTTGTGNVDNGTHNYRISFITSTGETELGTASNTVTVDASNKQVALSNIPISPSGAVIARKIYRSKAGGGNRYYLATINDNTTTTYTDNIADSSLGAISSDAMENSTFGKIIIDGIESLSLGAKNTFVGQSSGGSIGTGQYNVSLGVNALYSVVSGLYNVSIGALSLFGLTSGYDNVAVGLQALSSITTSGTNTAIGTGSLLFATGDGNVAIGYRSGFWETGSNSFYVNNQDRADLTGDRTLSLIYGSFGVNALSQQITFNVGTLSISDGGNIATGTTTGLKIGTSTSQKLGFYNKAPVAQPATVNDATDAASVILRFNELNARIKSLGLIA